MTTLTRTVCGTAVVLMLTTGITFGGPKKSAATDGGAVVNQSLAQLAAWQNQAARTTLESAKATLGTTPEFQTAWALLEFQEGTGTDATLAKKGFDTLNQAAKKQNSGAMTLFYQGELLYLQQKSNEAAAAWQAAARRAGEEVAKDPTDATSQFYLGAALVRQKQFDQALKALRLAVRGGFNEAMVNHQIGFIYLFQQKWQEAKEAFDLGLKVDPRYAPMYYWRGMVWEKLGRKDNMLLDLDQYVKLAPNAPEAGKARAILKSAGG